jgi:hypothetical protein
MTPQLKLFEPNFSSKIRRVEISGVMFFSVLDIFKHYSDTTNAAQSWRGVEAFLIKQGAISKDWTKSSDIENISLVMHQFPGERQRPTPIGSFKMIFRIAQVTTFKEWETMRDWMAGIAQERVEESANPALGIERAEARFLDAKVRQGMSREQAAAFLQQVQEGRIKRREWTETLKTVVIDVVNYGLATNTEYQGLFGRTAKQLRLETGFKTARDGMTLEGRALLTAVEATLDRLFRQRETLTFTEALTIIEEVCAVYRISVEGVQQMLGIDLATGKALLMP